MGHSLRSWIKSGNSPGARLAYSLAMRVRRFSVPLLPGVHYLLYRGRSAFFDVWDFLLRTLWYTPLFQSRLESPAPGLFLYGGIPLVLGSVEIRLGKNCRISGAATISGRDASSAVPQLLVGDNCDIGWQTTIAVGTKVLLGNNVRIAGRAFLAGYPGHPLDPVARAAGSPDESHQARDIVLENDVWLATDVIVVAGARIGEGTVVAAGSVVTRDLPAGVLAAGIPARVIHALGTSREDGHGPC